MVSLNSQSLSVQRGDDALSLEEPYLVLLGGRSYHACKRRTWVLVSVVQIESRRSILDVPLLVNLPDLSPVSRPVLNEQWSVGSSLHVADWTRVIHIQYESVCLVPDFELNIDWNQSPATIRRRRVRIEWSHVDTSSRVVSLNSQSLSVECRDDGLSLELPDLVSLCGRSYHTCERRIWILIPMMQVVARGGISNLSVVYFPNLGPVVGLRSDAERGVGSFWHLVRVSIVVNVQEETICGILNTILRSLLVVHCLWRVVVGCVCAPWETL